MNNDLWDLMNYYDEFHHWYLKIIKDFKFNSKKDEEARDLLSGILREKENGWELDQILDSFRQTINAKKSILIFGCGPTLEETLDHILKEGERKILEDSLILAADGASVLLREKEIPITAIFTDLDGISLKEFRSAQFNIIHAHGDNIEKLKEFKQAIINKKLIIGTTQVKPLYNVLNPGGFTDGDRILFFLKPLISIEHVLFLIGMDFNDIVGKYSKPNLEHSQKADNVKKKKLDYAFKLVKWLNEQLENKLYFVNTSINFDGFEKISITEFQKIAKAL